MYQTTDIYTLRLATTDPPSAPPENHFIPFQNPTQPPLPPSPVIRNDWPLNVNFFSIPDMRRGCEKINKGLLSNCFNSLWLRQILNLTSFSPTLVIALIVKFVI